MKTNEQIVKKIIQVTAFFWLIMKVISLKLWLKDRDYPLTPIADLPSWLHITLLGIFFLAAAWIIIKPGNKYLLMILVVTEVLSMLADQTRLQPWHYQFIFTFFAIAFNRKDRQKALQAIVLITVSTYLFSGIQKINPDFINTIWSLPVLKNFFQLPDHIIHNRIVQLSGYIIPLIEITGAIGLLFRKTMKWTALLLIGMHIFVLIFLGPLGLNYNVIVWPWNFQLIILLWLLFIKNHLRLEAGKYANAANFIIAFFWIVLPIAGCFGHWDKFLSSGMYSGREKVSRFYFTDCQKIPAALKKYATCSNENGTARISLTEWSIKELKVAPVSEKRVLKCITNRLNEKYADDHVKFILETKNY
jgi:hypothetical protein